MSGRLWRQASDSVVDVLPILKWSMRELFYRSTWQILYAVVVFLVVKFLLKLLIGLNIGFINPLRLRVCHLSYKDKIQISYIQFKPWQKKITVSGLKLKILKEKSNNTEEVKAEKKENSNKKSLAKYAKYFPILRRILDGFEFHLEDLQLSDLGISIAGIGLIISTIPKTGQLDTQFYLRKVLWKDEIICNESIISFKADTVTEAAKLNESQFLENIYLDLKFGGINIPMNYLAAFKKSKETVDVGHLLDYEESEQDILVRNKLEMEMEMERLRFTDEDIFEAVNNIENILDTVREYSDILSDFTISIDKFGVKNMMVTSHPALLKMNDYMNYSFCCSNFTFNASKYRNDMPGFKLLFKEEDSTFKISSAISRIDFNVNLNRVDNNTSEVLKLVSIPNITLFGETNILSQKFRTCNTTEAVSENSLFNIKSTISSPTIDVSLSDLSFLKSFKKNIKVFTSTCSGCMFKNEVRKENSHTKMKQILSTYFKTFLPLINLKFSLEDPKFIINHNNNLIMAQLSVLVFDYESMCDLVAINEKRKEIIYESWCNVELLDVNLIHINKHQKYEQSIFSSDSIAINNKLKLLPDLIVSSEMIIDTLNVDLSELPTLKMLSDVVRKLDDEIYAVEQFYFNNLYEEFSTVIRNAKKQCNVIGKNMVENEIPLKEMIYKSLPDFFDYFLLTVRNVSATLGIRSVFMPKDKFTSLEPQSGKDFIDGKLRKYCNQINKLQVTFFGNKTQWHSNINGGHVGMTRSGDENKYKSYYASELDDISTSDATEVERPWNLSLLIDKITSTIIGECPQLSDKLTIKTVAKIAIISIKVFPETEYYDTNENAKVIVQIENKSIKAIISLMNIFFILSGIHTLHHIFGNAVEENKGPSKAKKFFLAVSKVKKKSSIKKIRWTDIKQMLTVNIHSEQYEQIFVLPNELRTSLDFSHMFLTIENLNNISFTGEYFRTCIESPTIKHYWVRLITIVRYKVNADIEKLKSQTQKNNDSGGNSEPGVTLENESWHFSIPYDFEMFRIFDNFSTIAKTLKQLIYSFKSSKNDLVIFAKPVSAAILPNIKLKSNRLLFTVDDDPFEAELNSIFQIGLQEQRSRLEKRKEFNEQALKSLHGRAGATSHTDISVEELIWKKRLKINKKNTPDQLIKQNMPLVNTPFNIDGKQNKNKTADHLITAELETEYDKLQEQLSHSWIERIRSHKQKQHKKFLSDFTYVWGRVNYSKLPDDINKRVLDFSTNPFLTTLIIEDIDVDIAKPHCGVEHIPDFIYEVGKGVPKDTKYSILVPMHLDAKFSEIRWHLRDYPLPFVYMPKLLPSQSRESQSIRIHGDFMVTEDMIYSEQELRTVFVPLVPSIIVENKDKLYSLLVPRTMTSIKLFTNLEFDLHSKDTLTVTWGGSYSPAIQQVMQCLDNFSKPPLDPSPKVGFWDKVRYIFHGRININLKNNGKFEIALKGSKSPYKIGGRDAGFVIGFEDDVKIICNPNDDPKDFLTCSADRVHFSIPNHFAKPLLVWSSPSKDAIFIPNQSDTNLQESASFYYLLNLEDKVNQNSDIHSMKGAYIEKTGIKLTGGMKLKLGFVFERLIRGTSDRTYDSRNHWDVRLCNPIYVSDLHDHDSFNDFRSDFIHLSLVLTSKSETSYNALQLSPKGLRTFFSWWKMFSGNFPVRRGPLFGLQSIAPKFGEHLETLTYYADVSPLYITHMYHNLDADKIMKKSFLDTSEYAGIKAKAGRFLMDLHQRKEVFTEYQEELDRIKKVQKLKFLDGLVATFDIDIRAVHGLFTKLEYTEQREDAKYDIHDNDMQWIDLTDFQEAFYVEIDNFLPNIKILPMLSAHKFIYSKHASYGDKYQVDPKTYNPIKPFDNSISHDCAIRKPFTPNFEVIRDRLERLKHVKATIESNHYGMDSESEQKAHEKYLVRSEASVRNVQSLLEDLEIMTGLKEKIDSSKAYNYPAIQLIQDTNSESFDNKYYVYHMLLKWNEGVRDIAFKFLHFSNLTHQFMELASHKTNRMFNDIINKRQQKDNVNEEEDISSKIQRVKSEVEFDNANDDEHVKAALLEMFEEGLSQLGIDINHSISRNHFVNFICPQIQLISDDDPNICVLVSTPIILLKVLSFDEETPDNVYLENTFLKRYGLFLSNANAFIFHKERFDKYPELVFDASLYGQEKGSDWPPWLGAEVAFHPTPLSKFAVIENFSAFTFLQKLLPFSSMYDMVKDVIENKISACLPRVIVSATSEDYLAIYKIVTNLILYVEPDNKSLKKQIETASLAFDFDDIERITSLIGNLTNAEQVLERIVKEFIFKRRLLKDVDLIDLSNIYNERMNHLLQLYVILRVFTESNRDESNCTVLWDFKIKEVVLHMLHNSSTPFLDVIVNNVNYQRLQTDTGFTDNMVSVRNINIFNRDKDAIYPTLVKPYSTRRLLDTQYDDQPVVAIRWGVDKPVGGIRIVKSVTTNITGLVVTLEEETINRIISWLSLEHLKNLSPENEDSDNSSMGSESISDMSFSQDTRIHITGTKDIDEMFKRSTNFLTIENMLINSFKLMISYKGKGKMRLANVTNFLFTFPTLIFENQTMTLADLMIKIKKILIKVLIKHTGKFLGTKLKNHPSDLSKEQPKGDDRKMIEYTKTVENGPTVDAIGSKDITE